MSVPIWIDTDDALPKARHAIVFISEGEVCMGWMLPYDTTTHIYFYDEVTREVKESVEYWFYLPPPPDY